MRALAQLTLALSLIACALATLAADAIPAPVARALKSAGLPSTSVAIVVQEVDARQPRISVNAAQPLNPASVMKLLTTYAALELLGPAYTWKTEAYTHGKLTDGVLEGDLILKGYGDPKLNLENFWLLLRQLRARGLREIRGDLVLDHSFFEAVDYDPARFDNEPLRAYNVAPDALLVNFKAVRLQFVPQPDSLSVQVIADPLPAQVDIINLLTLTTAPCNGWKEALRTDVTTSATRWRVILTGNYSADCGEKITHLSLLTHPQFAYGVFRRLWEESGGKLTGGMRIATLPTDAQRMAVMESPALTEVVRDINKYSNNVMARQVYLTLGADASKRPAREQDADAAIRDWLVRKGLTMPELVIDNGAGLSRNARISAESLGKLLLAAWRSPLMPEFIASLPLVAIDGTMQNRLTANSIAGQAHIKTGSLEGARAIAGYVLDKNGKQQVVVFLVNHTHAAASQAAQDALLQCVYERSC